MEINEQIAQIEQSIEALKKERAELQGAQAAHDFQSILNDYQEAKKKMLINVKKSFPLMIAPLMMRSDKITSVSFTAYSPYFNDGDECVYRVRHNFLIVNGDWDENLPDGWNSQDEAVISDIKKVLKSVDDDVYKEVFGNHVQITIHIDGTIDTDEYEHD